MLHDQTLVVSNYIKYCPDCQKQTNDLRHKAPYIPYPLLAAHSSKLHLTSWALTHVQRRITNTSLPAYASRFPEAIPLSSVNEVSIANAMIEIFSRCGLAEEILTNQGSVFYGKIDGPVVQIARHKAHTYLPLPCTD